MDRKSLSLLAMLSILLVSFAAATSSATDHSRIGVRIGDTAEYSTPNVSHDRLRIAVQNVTGAWVTLTYIHHLPNGTITHTDYVTGNVSSSYFFGILLPTDLHIGDLLPGTQCRVNSTLTMIVAGSPRTVLNATWFSSGIWTYCYFDQVPPTVKLLNTLTSQFGGSSLII